MELCNTLMKENVNMQDIADGVAAEIDGAAVQQENIAEVALVQNEEIQNEGVPNQDDDDVDEAEV